MKIYVCKYELNGVDYINLIRASSHQDAQRIFEAHFSPEEKHPTFMDITEISKYFDYKNREEMVCI